LLSYPHSGVESMDKTRVDCLMQRLMNACWDAGYFTGKMEQVESEESGAHWFYDQKFAKAKEERDKWREEIRKELG